MKHPIFQFTSVFIVFSLIIATNIYLITQFKNWISFAGFVFMAFTMIAFEIYIAGITKIIREENNKNN